MYLFSVSFEFLVEKSSVMHSRLKKKKKQRYSNDSTEIFFFFFLFVSRPFILPRRIRVTMAARE